MSRVFQEFYCGNCDGYFRCKINRGITYGVKLICPSCGHDHHRYIKGGIIYENGRESNFPVEEICPPKSSYSKEPYTEKMKKTKNMWSKRDGIVIKIEQENTGSTFLRELWLEKSGG